MANANTKPNQHYALTKKGRTFASAPLRADASPLERQAHELARAIATGDLPPVVDGNDVKRFQAKKFEEKAQMLRERLFSRLDSIKQVADSKKAEIARMEAEMNKEGCDAVHRLQDELRGAGCPQQSLDKWFREWMRKEKAAERVRVAATDLIAPESE